MRKTKPVKSAKPLTSEFNELCERAKQNRLSPLGFYKEAKEIIENDRKNSHKEGCYEICCQLLEEHGLCKFYEFLIKILLWVAPVGAAYKSCSLHFRAISQIMNPKYRDEYLRNLIEFNDSTFKQNVDIFKLLVCPVYHALSLAHMVHWLAWLAR